MLQSVPAASPPNVRRRLRLVVFHDGPRVWRARGLEHDFVVEARTIGEAVRMAVRLVEAHTAFDIRHRHIPLTAFLPAPERCWSAYMKGTPISLMELGVPLPDDWEICAAVAYRHPVDSESVDGQRILS
jgi:hypothetical protein